MNDILNNERTRSARAIREDMQTFAMIPLLADVFRNPTEEGIDSVITMAEGIIQLAEAAREVLRAKAKDKGKGKAKAVEEDGDEGKGGDGEDEDGDGEDDEEFAGIADSA